MRLRVAISVFVAMLLWDGLKGGLCPQMDLLSMMTTGRAYNADFVTE
jgi:hypothetical protein